MTEFIVNNVKCYCQTLSLNGNRITVANNGSLVEITKLFNGLSYEQSIASMYMKAIDFFVPQWVVESPDDLIRMYLKGGTQNVQNYS